jgi:hypothetical protein
VEIFSWAILWVEIFRVEILRLE